MEIIKIEKDKLIFILSADDAAKYFTEASSSTPLLKESYTRIISDNNIEEAFLSGVLVELFESKDGGLEMFVTKLSDTDEASGRSPADGTRHIYILTKLNDLIGACHMLKKRKYENALIYENQKKYYLTISKEEPYLSEFGAKKCDLILNEYLAEHYNLMPIETVSALAELYR